MLFQILRLIWPIGAVLVVLATVIPYFLITGNAIELDAKFGAYCFILYLYCSFLKVKQALRLAAFSCLVSILYSILLTNTEFLDFEYSSVIFGVVCFSTVVLISSTRRYVHKRKVIRYFLLRQMGSLDDIFNFTKLSENQLIDTMGVLLDEDKISMLTKDPPLFKWNDESINFSEGIESIELTIEDLA